MISCKLLRAFHPRMCAETTHLIWASLSTTKGSHSGGSRARHFFQCKPQALLPTRQCSPSPYTAKGVLSKSHDTCFNCTSIMQRHSKTLDMPNRNQEIILRINQTRKQNFVEVDGALPAHRQQKNAPYPKKKNLRMGARIIDTYRLSTCSTHIIRRVTAYLY